MMINSRVQRNTQIQYACRKKGIRQQNFCTAILVAIQCPGEDGNPPAMRKSSHPAGVWLALFCIVI